jgi:site-specific recombinase XerD
MSELQGLNQTELQKLLSTVTDSRDRAIIVLGLRHGFRSSEIADLRMSDLDLDNRLIRVRRGKGSETNNHEIADGPEALHELTVLHKALEDRPANSSCFVFVSQKGGKLHRSQIFRIFQQAATKAGLPRQKRHYHCAKHTLAFNMLKSGATLPETQKYLGWKSLATAGRYLAVTDETACKAAKNAFKLEAA